MANLFVLNVAGMVAPWAADKNANRLIAIAVERLAGEGGAPQTTPGAPAGRGDRAAPGGGGGGGGN